ncbi:MAG: Ig-like domain-containing protein, partial [Pseudomonadota bacterium]
MSSAVAQEGLLDAGLDENGWLELNVDLGSIEQVEVHGDRSIAVAGKNYTGKYLLTRFRSDGTLDSGFGSNGVVVSPFSGAPRGLAVDGQGRYLMAGDVYAAEGGAALVRFTASGSLDTGFGGDYDGNGVKDGYLLPGVEREDDTFIPLAVAVDGEGRYLLPVIRHYYDQDTSSYAYRLGVFRLSSSGELDSSFGEGGYSETSALPMVVDNIVKALGEVFITRDGAILVAASAGISDSSYIYDSLSDNRIVLAKFDGDGTLSDGFGADLDGDEQPDGVTVDALERNSGGNFSAALHNDGTISLLPVGSEGIYSPRLYRYRADGLADDSFGQQGNWIELSAISDDDSLASMLAQPDDSLLVASGREIHRYSYDGTEDQTFTLVEVEDSDPYSIDERPYSLMFQAQSLDHDGYIVAAGKNEDNSDLVLLRAIGFDPEGDGEANPWPVVPDLGPIPRAEDVELDSMVLSEPVAITGLASGYRVPVKVRDGEYAINYSGDEGEFTAAPGYASNGDTVTLRHRSASTTRTETSSTLCAGGFYRYRSPALAPVDPVCQVFTSKTLNADPEVTVTPQSVEVSQKMAPGYRIAHVTATDHEGDPLTLSIDEGNTGNAFKLYPDSGDIALDGTLDMAVTPSYTLTIAARDEFGGLGTDELTVTVIPNVPPAPAADTFATYEEVATTTTSVLYNDSDLDDDDASLFVEDYDRQSSQGGTVSHAGEGRFHYTPVKDFYGEDTFRYRVSDGMDGVWETVTMTVDNVNDAPVAEGQTVSVAEEGSVAITLSASDVDDGAETLSYEVEGQPLHGSLSGTPPELTYTPEADFNGEDSFSFVAIDPDGARSQQKSVAITVTPINDAPTAADGAITVPIGGSRSSQLEAYDVDGDALSFTIVEPPQQGEVSLSGDGLGSFTYTA